eukprot:TRINITY_DN2119_c0_g1_i1.p1 TRINITY_DN2119_c0_g1~~TRINITY_DN2119_c0_g1_i1.p1  ORF type:complete len:149 (-),score=23.91 TRINITY_DN2119_c0_g1_i1:207-653(-)
MHWAVLVCFHDEQNETYIIRLCQLEQVDKIIRHKYSGLAPRSVSEMEQWKRDGQWTFCWQSASRVNFSPVGLKTVCDSNPLNGRPYDKVNANCQEWAMQILRGMGFDISQAPSTLQNAGLPNIVRQACENAGRPKLGEVAGKMTPKFS